MSSILGIPDVAIGGVVAALIAGVISLVGLIVAKEQKISEFRQAWINELRVEIASLITHANAIHGSFSVGWQNATDAWKDVRADYVGINEAAGKIRLRLNPDETASKKVLQAIEEIEQIMNPDLRDLDYRNLNRLEKRLVDEANLVLKSEWRRVKRGEPVYKIAKYAALTVVSSSILAVVVFALYHSTAGRSQVPFDQGNTPTLSRPQPACKK